MAILNDNEFEEVEGRQYVNPNVSLNESTNFIDNLRSMQDQQNQEITQQTQNLGTNISTNLGGLTGADSYFTSRYQVPQTNAAVANLRATAQAQALNQVLSNEQEKWKKRYQDAYRAYQKSAYDKSNQPASLDTTIDGGVDEESMNLEGRGKITLDENDIAAGGQYVVEYGDEDHPNSNIVRVGPDGSNTTYYQQSDGSYSTTRPGSGGGSGLPTVDLIQLITDYKYNGTRSGNSNPYTGGGGGR